MNLGKWAALAVSGDARAGAAAATTATVQRLAAVARVTNRVENGSPRRELPQRRLTVEPRGGRRAGLPGPMGQMVMLALAELGLQPPPASAPIAGEQAGEDRDSADADSPQPDQRALMQALLQAFLQTLMQAVRAARPPGGAARAAEPFVSAAGHPDHRNPAPLLGLPDERASGLMASPLPGPSLKWSERLASLLSQVSQGAAPDALQAAFDQLAGEFRPSDKPDASTAPQASLQALLENLQQRVGYGPGSAPTMRGAVLDMKV